MPETEANDLLTTLGSVAEVLDAIGVEWAVGGSIASTAYGEPRSTNDVDIVAALDHVHVSLIHKRLGTAFYVDTEMMHAAISARGSFNLIDERTFIKVDVFVPTPGPLGLGQLERRRVHPVGAHSSIQILAPEDVVLQKLRWFDIGGRQSDRQWRDVVEVLRISGKDLDRGYMQRVCTQAQLDELLHQAWLDAAGSLQSR